MARISLIEITDPFAEDFGLIKNEVEINEGTTLKEFLTSTFPDVDMEAYINCTNVSYDTILTDRNMVLACGTVGKSSILQLVASIAVMVVAWQAAPLLLGALHIEATAFALGVTASMISMVGMALVNALLSPDIPDMSGQGFDQSRAYSWDGATNTSRQMIPIPVVLGKYQVAGNLLHTYTKTHKVQSGGISIRDTIYLMFGLTANELSSIESCHLNDMDASTFDDDDRSVYYTLGTATQLPLSTTSSELYPTDETPAPASDGILFPNIVSEDISNQEIPLPHHTFKESTTTVQRWVPDEAIDVKGEITDDLAANETKVLPITVYTWHPNDFPAKGIAEIVHSIDRTETYSALVYYESGSVTTIIDNVAEGTISIQIHDGTNRAFFSGDKIAFYETAHQTEDTITIPGSLYYDEDGDWLREVQEKQSSYITEDVSLTEIDDIIIQVVFPQGLYGMTDNGHRRSCFVGFDFEVTAIIGGTTYTANYDLSEVAYDQLSDTEKKYTIKDKIKTSIFVEFNVTDILKESTTTGDKASMLDADGYLVDGTYTIGIRAGIAGYQDQLKLFEPDHDGHTLYNKVQLTKVRGVKYKTVLNYPYISLLGLVLNATPVLNNRLPKQVVEVKGNYYVHKTGEDETKVSEWTREFSENPAYLAINMLYDSLWGGAVGGVEGDTTAEKLTKDTNFAQLVDIPEFLELADYCDELVTIEVGESDVPRFTFNGLFDTKMGLWEALSIVLKAANATPLYNGKQITIYYEKEETSSVSQIFSSTNIKPGSFSETFIDDNVLAECINGNFIDASNHYEKTSIMYLPPGASPQKSTTIELIGTVDYNRALHQIKEKLNKTQALRKFYKFTVADSSAIASEVGDFIGIQYEFINFAKEDSGSTISGRVKTFDGTFTITLDKLITEITTTPHIIVRVNTGDIYTWEIQNWNNTGDTTVLIVNSSTPSSELAKLNELDPYLIGESADYYKEAILTSLVLNEDLSVDIEAIEYDASLYDDFFGLTINSQLNPELDKDDCVVNDLLAEKVTDRAEVKVSWTAPILDADIIGYLVYRKVNEEPIQFIENVNITEFIDTDIDFLDSLYYKVLPIFFYRGAERTIPLGWADYSVVVNITSQLSEYLTAPDFDLFATKNSEGENLYDLTVKVEDPRDWLCRDNREGFWIWTRFSSVATTDDWFGPTDITLTSACTAGAEYIYVNKTDGLPLYNFGTEGSPDYQVTGLLMLDNQDLVAVLGVDSVNPLKLQVVEHLNNGLDNRKFAISKNHASGISVYNAHKGFMPVRYFSLKDYCTAYDKYNIIAIDDGHLYSYNPTTNCLTVSDGFDDLFINNKNQLFVYVDGDTNSMYACMNFFNVPSYNVSAVELMMPVSADDFAIHSVSSDITGQALSLYQMYWESPQDYQKLKINTANELEGTIAKIPVTAPYVWVAVSRVLWEYDFNEVWPTRVYTSNPKLWEGN